MEGNNTEGTEGQQSPAQGEGGTEGQPKDYRALYEDSVKESRFDYQSVRHCSKTRSGQPAR